MTHLDAGTYDLRVLDLSAGHNFHLLGPGVDLATGVLEEGEVDWTVSLTDGAYAFFCDPHSGEMSGGFFVGRAQPAVARTSTMRGRVTPHGISLARIALAGRYAITIRDASTTDDFHLTGRGVDRRTSIRGTGTAVWHVTLAPGPYAFRSDANPRLRGTLQVASTS